MLLAQLTDLHIGFDRANREEANVLRLRAVLRRLRDGPNRPGAVLLSGDLTEHGDAASFAVLAEELAALPVPVFPIPGNHDTREALLAAFPETPTTAEGFVQYAVTLGGLRIVMLDTLESGRHGGGLCEARAGWLERELSDNRDQTVLLVTHHPPFASGIAWMDPAPGEAWSARLAGAIGGHGRIAAITSGHLHRAVVSRWQGHTAMICPSTAPPVALDLTPIDPERADGRALISAEPAGYGLHRWDGASLASHFEWIGGQEPIARFDPGLQGMVSAMMAERQP